MLLSKYKLTKPNGQPRNLGIKPSFGAFTLQT